MCKICIFAGTTEGRSLIERLSGRGAQLLACVATEYGETLLGEHDGVRVLSGRLNAQEMAELFRREDVDCVVDATHPYADKVTENLCAACEESGTRYLRLLRASSSADSDGVFVENTAACVAYLKAVHGTVLLTTGSKELPAFCEDEALRDRLYVRVLPMAASLQTCADCGIAPARIIAMQGPFDEEMNLAMLRMTGAKFLVTKDTGGAGGYGAKIAAARTAGATPVVIGRPPQREGFALDAALHMLEVQYSLKPRKKRVTLAGIGMGGAQTRTLGMERAVREADCLIGARRMLESVDAAEKRAVALVDPQEIARCIREDPGERFVVLLSGDTGFYSGAKKLLTALGDMEVDVLPGIGSLSYFCARLGRSWEDVRAVSLHGRECDLVREVRTNAAVFALVGGSDGVNRALRLLCAAGLGDLLVHVGERLGYPEERLVHGSAQELLDAEFDALSVLLIENERSGEFVVTHGLPDERFDRDETPMTKSEVRSISLSKLALTRNAVVYDVGSGSGSVSVEAALQVSGGRVFAIEMKEKAIALTRRNAEKFHLVNLEVVAGSAPEALRELPPPTHAFIGGSAGSLRGIIDCLLEKNPGVRIVVNTVTLETLAELIEISKEFEFADAVEVSVAKPRAVGRYRLMNAQNPVFIFTLQNGGERNG